MKFLLSVLLLSSVSAYSQEMYTEQDMLNNNGAPLPGRLVLEKNEKHYNDDCKDECSDSKIMDVFKLRNKHYLAMNNASTTYYGMKDDDALKSFAKLSYYKEAVKFLEADGRYKTLQVEYLKKKAAEAEKICKPEAVKDESLIVNDTNRSFFKRLSDIFSFTKDGPPAPVEDRNTTLSK